MHRSRKQDVEGTLSPGEADPLIDYDNLPMSFLRFRTRAALKKVTDRSEGRAVFENRPIHPSMLYSLPFIHQPAAVARGMTGNGATSVPDQIPCFSNSAPFLTMLAPGAFITAGGVQMAGTSQASPHVAGAAAMARSAFPADTLDQTIGRLTSAGMPVTDPRNGILTPRLDLNAIAQPVPVPALPAAGAGITAVLLAALLFHVGKRM